MSMCTAHSRTFMSVCMEVTEYFFNVQGLYLFLYVVTAL